MADFKLIPVDQIIVPDRLRAVEEEHALAIAQSIVEHGLINPITVRATPAAKGGKWTLVAGAHRLRAFELNGEPEIEAMIVEGDKAEAQLIEITENLFRNDLSVMDRAIFVQSYRDIWESKYGAITRGGDQKSNRQLDGLGGAIAQTLRKYSRMRRKQGSFSQHVAERMGVSKSAIERWDRIAKNLQPALRTKLRGTPAADNQSMLSEACEGRAEKAGADSWPRSTRNQTSRRCSIWRKNRLLKSRKRTSSAPFVPISKRPGKPLTA